jgi:hypothetical protein
LRRVLRTVRRLPATWQARGYHRPHRSARLMRCGTSRPGAEQVASTSTSMTERPLPHHWRGHSAVATSTFVKSLKKRKSLRRFTWLILSEGTLCSSEEERLAVLHTAHPIEGYTVQQSIEFRWEEVVNVSSSVLLLVLFCIHKGIGEEEDERHCRAVRGRSHRRVRCTAVRRVRWAEVEVCCQRKVDLDNETMKRRKRNSKKAIRLGLGE